MKHRQAGGKKAQARRTQELQHAAAREWIYVAQVAFERCSFVEAEDAARRVLRIAPGHPSATLLLAEVFLRASRYREIAGLAREAIRHHPGDPRFHFVLADACLATGDLTEARNAAVRFQELMASSPQIYFGSDRRSFGQRGRLLLREIDRKLASGTAPGAAPRRERSPARGTAPLRPAARLAPATSSAPEAPAAATPPAALAPVREPPPEVAFEDDPSSPALSRFLAETASDDLAGRELLLESHRIMLLSQYEDLLCLPTLQGVERHEYQVETARKILRRLSGRALLCDEVGLGKTIEAGMVIKEYLLRGLAQSVLILVPPGLVQQWQDEMSAKFALNFRVLDGGSGGPAAAAGDLWLASVAFARHGRNLAAFTERDWDMVVVDEAHHIRRRTTRSWALVNALRKRFVLLLSATPVHNDLMELYELVTLVKPGLLGTPSEFRRRFVGGKRGAAREQEQLRDLLAEVMVRNTRSHADVVLPPRFATTLLLQPHASEARAYQAASAYASRVYPQADMPGRLWLRHLLGCAGSGPRAVAEAAARRLGRTTAAEQSSAAPQELRAAVPTDTEAGENRMLLQQVVEATGEAPISTKAEHLVEMLRGSEEQMVVFCRYHATLSELSNRLGTAGVSHAVYHGSLPRSAKDAAIAAFRAGARVLLSSESGGEGRNIHFCRAIVNYDLPWDPMLIEQRIGRVHRIGQTRDVFVFNLALAGTVEEELLRILEEKIHLFELIVGEVDSILGHLERREEFADILLGLWAEARDDAERRQRFEAFGQELAKARGSYEREKELGESLLADELEA